MLDMTLFRKPAFVSVSFATFCLGAGMFALFPFLSIYLQDVLGYSPLGAGVRFLPLTAFVFAVPLATRRVAPRLGLRTMLAGGLVLVALALLLMHGLSASSGWTALLAGFILGGIGVGIANPAIAGAALRTVDPGRTGMASGFNNTCRLAGVAIGVAALGAVLEHSIATSLAPTLGPHDRVFAEAVSSAGVRAAAGRPLLVHAASTAFVTGMNDLFVIGAVAVFAGAVAVAVFLRTRAPATAPVTEPAQP